MTKYLDYKFLEIIFFPKETVLFVEKLKMLSNFTFLEQIKSHYFICR